MKTLVFPSLIFALIIYFTFSHCPENVVGGIARGGDSLCYVPVKTPSTWLRAEKTCRTLGGRLAEVNSTEQASFIGGLTQMNGGGFHWISMTTLFDGKIWTTADERNLSFIDWAPRKLLGASPVHD